MPQWAGRAGTSCATSTPTNERALVDPENERYWMGPQFEGDCGGVDLYVGGAEHAVLHLLYARFWHKVLVRPGPCLLVRAVPSPDQPGHDPGRGVRRRPRSLRRCRRGRRARRRLLVRRSIGSAASSARWVRACATRSPRTTCIAATAPTPCGCTRCSPDPSTRAVPWDTKAVVGVFRLLQRIWRNVVDENSGVDHRQRRCPGPRHAAGPAPCHRTPYAPAWKACGSTCRSPGSPSSTTT